MTPLEQFVSEAQVVSAGDLGEVARILPICNACRYCEGYCAVFPAMTRRLEFPEADIHYLANLCHNCGACLHSCQYAPPHEFAVNVPAAMARVRVSTYAKYAWPAVFGRLYAHAGLATAAATGIGVAIFLLLAAARHGTLGRTATGGDFYRVFPHDLLVGLFGPVFGFSCLALAIGVARFWRAVSPGKASESAMREAAGHVFTLTYLGGGHGEGCNEADDRFTLWRRRFHHATFYGFALCFAATCVATVYHIAFGWQAPYAVSSVPVVLGTLGGIGLLVGPLGLLWLDRRRDPLHGDQTEKALDRGLLVLLLATSATGLALLATRETAAMAWFLSVHLAFVMALFLTMPYGKFAHGVYRGAALLKWAIERRQPDRLRLGSE